jgi:hypothetical protein
MQANTIQNQVTQLQSQFDQNEHLMWLSQSATSKILHKLKQKRLEKLELAAAKSQDTATSELELRRLLNEAAGIGLALRFLETGQ